MNRRLKIFSVLAAAHLLLLLMGAAHVRVPRGNWILDLFEEGHAVYGVFTGVNSGFGFFAPEIGSELKARFELSDDQGRRFDDKLESRVSREAALRLNSLFSRFGEQVKDARVRRRMAASLGAKMLARYPRAHSVSVILEGYELPSLHDYPQVRRTGWEPFYRATFTRQPRNR